jgi:hypothetical protein
MERELRIVSDDGESILLADSSGNKYRAERKSAPHPTLISVPTASGSSELTIKEIQARLRAGQSPREISESTGTALEKIERFSGPILHERNHIISHALDTQVRRGRSELTLREVVNERLGARGVDINALEWNGFRQEDGTWIISVHYPTREGQSSGEWILDTNKRTLAARDEGARWISGDDRSAQEKVRSQLPTELLGGGAEREPREAPRLAAVREEVDPSSDAARDGVVGRAKVPSWDEIMFGKKTEE